MVQGVLRLFDMTNLAELQAKRQRWDDARATIDEARRIAERRLGPQSERAGECRTLSGVIELDAGNLATALTCIQQTTAARATNAQDTFLGEPFRKAFFLAWWRVCLRVLCAA